MKLYCPITIDLYRVYPLQVMEAQQGNVGRGAIVTLTAGSAVINPTDETTEVYVKKPDGTVSWLECSVEDGKIKIDFTNQMLMSTGVLQVELRMKNEDDDITTPIFKVKVNKSNVQSAGRSENELPLLDQIKKNVEEAKAAAEAAEQDVRDKITNPVIGAVGQILEIEYVDEEGKPLSYKAVDKPETVDKELSQIVHASKYGIVSDGFSDTVIVIGKDAAAGDVIKYVIKENSGDITVIYDNNDTGEFNITTIDHAGEAAGEKTLTAEKYCTYTFPSEMDVYLPFNIPAKTSQLTDDVGFAKQEEVGKLSEENAELKGDLGKVEIDGWEQGTINLQGNLNSSTTRIRACNINITDIDYVLVNNPECSVCVRFYFSNGDIRTWDGSDLTNVNVEGIWEIKDVPIYTIREKYPDIETISFMLRYNDNRKTTISDKKYLSAFLNKFARFSDLDNKVDKQDGKGLSTNDFTDEEKNKLDSIKLDSIKNAVIYDMPSTIVKPTVEFETYIQEDNTKCGAKPSVFVEADTNHGLTYIGLTYGENLDGNTKDLPSTSETGTLDIKYRYLALNNGVESVNKFGTVAKKGDKYIDYEGNEKTFTGGCGLPSAIANLQYFSSVVSANKYNNGVLQQFIPCVVKTSFDEDDLIFEDIHELTLTIDGVKGQFDLWRLGYNALYAYYTTTPPTKISNNKYSWMQPLPDGIAYLTSFNGIDWNFEYKIDTPYVPMYEVTNQALNDNILFACRTGWDKQELFVGVIDIISKNIKYQYRINDIGARPFLVKSGSDYLLFHTIGEKRIHSECIRIINEVNGLGFYRWFSIYNKMTWYTFLNSYTVSESNFDKMYIAGGNGKLKTTNSMTFAVLDFDTSKPRTLDKITEIID